MIKMIKLVFFTILIFNISNVLFAKNNFFEQGKKKFLEKEYETSKFFFQRGIVFNPKDINSYLYLAKIYNFEENKLEEEKNINTVILLDPKNEEAIYMLIKIELKNSNYLKVKELNETFSEVCTKLCKKKKSILEALKDLEPKNES